MNYTTETRQQEINMSDITQPYAEFYAKRLLAYVNEVDAEKIKREATETQPGIYVRHRNARDVQITMTIDFNKETVTALAQLSDEYSTVTHKFSDYTPPTDDEPEYVLIA